MDKQIMRWALRLTQLTAGDDRYMGTSEKNLFSAVKEMLSEMEVALGVASASEPTPDDYSNFDNYKPSSRVAS